MACVARCTSRSRPSTGSPRRGTTARGAGCGSDRVYHTPHQKLESLLRETASRRLLARARVCARARAARGAGVLKAARRRTATARPVLARRWPACLERAHRRKIGAGAPGQRDVPLRPLGVSIHRAQPLHDRLLRYRPLRLRGTSRMWLVSMRPPGPSHTGAGSDLSPRDNAPQVR